MTNKFRRTFLLFATHGKCDQSNSKNGHVNVFGINIFQFKIHYSPLISILIFFVSFILQAMPEIMSQNCSADNVRNKQFISFSLISTSGYNASNLDLPKRNCNFISGMVKILSLIRKEKKSISFLLRSTVRMNLFIMSYFIVNYSIILYYYLLMPNL